MSKSISFPALTDEVTFLQSRAAANSFFSNFSVASATPVEEGVVKKASLATFSILPTVNVDYIQIVQDGVNLGQVPTLARYEELATLVENLRQKISALMAAMNNAGQLELL